MKLRLLSLMVAVGLLPAIGFAADAPKAGPATDARQAELDQARAELKRSARRVAELSRELGGQDFQFEFEREVLAGDRARPGIGIVLAANPAAAGVRLAAVTPDGPAAKAGLRAGDVLISVDGKAIGGKGDAAIEQSRELLSGLRQDQEVRLGYAREGKSGQVTVRADNVNRLMVYSSRSGAHAEAVAREMSRARPLIDPKVQVEIARLGTAPCAPGHGDCEIPALTQAFRWNGLNLATVDAKLGRYFGTDRGVLVLSGGDSLAALEPGDVIQRIDGGAVASPRDAMRALRDQDTGEQVDVEILRDRKRQTIVVTVPEAPSVRWFAPPAPPVPPTAPTPPAPPSHRTPGVAPPAPPAPPEGAPPTPPTPPEGATLAMQDGVVARIVSQQRWVDEDGSEHIVIKTQAHDAE